MLTNLGADGLDGLYMYVRMLGDAGFGLWSLLAMRNTLQLVHAYYHGYWLSKGSYLRFK